MIFVISDRFPLAPPPHAHASISSSVTFFRFPKCWNYVTCWPDNNIKPHLTAAMYRPVLVFLLSLLGSIGRLFTRQSVASPFLPLLQSSKGVHARSGGYRLLLESSLSDKPQYSRYSVLFAAPPRASDFISMPSVNICI